MPRGLQKGDPRARIAGRKAGLASGKARHKTAKPVEWLAGYSAGWVAYARYLAKVRRAG